jgi:DNA-binding transcriptional regulator PaaX
MKLLKLKILFALANDVDLFSAKEGFLYFSYLRLYWRLAEYVDSSVRDGISQLVSTGHVMKIKRRSRPNFRLTEVGREELLARFPLSQRRGRWDRTWRLVVVDSSKTQSSEVRWLRQRLRDLGCLNLERGVYITPHNISKDIKSMLVQKSLLGGVTALEAKKFIVGDDRAFAATAWSLDELVSFYQKFIGDTNKLIREVRSTKELTQRLKKEFISVFNRWFNVLQKDPGLPSQLLPSDWGFEEAKVNYLKLAGSVWELEEEKARPLMI